jgi:ABC-type uncharacterized transport system involved in gliding motility auxiliary subunit
MTSVSKQIWSVLPWFGMGLVLMGLSAGVVSGQWNTVPLSLLCVGGLCFGLWLLRLVSSRSFWVQRSTQSGLNAVIVALAMILILLMINVLGLRYTQRIDLSENQVNSLAPQSMSAVRGLKQPVKLWAFTPGGAKAPQLLQLFEQYRRIDPDRFNFEFVDPKQRPQLAEKFGVKSIGELHLERADRNQFIQNVLQDEVSEAKLTNALLYLDNNQKDTVYLTAGHGEHDLAKLAVAAKLLEDRNYIPKTLMLSQGIPSDAKTIVLAGPQRAFLPAEIEGLKTFLAKGGGLMVLVDPNTEPNLNGLLIDWGVSLDDRLIIEGGEGGAGSLSGAGPTVPIVTTYGDHPITQNFNGGYSLYPVSRALRLDSKPGITGSALLETGSKTWAEKDLQDTVSFDASADLKGPLTLGVALSRSIGPSPAPSASPTPSDAPSDQPVNAESPSPTPSPSPSPTPSPLSSPAAALPPSPESRLVVIGNSSFITDSFISQYLNPDVFVNSITWLSQRQNVDLSIAPKKMTERRLTLTEGFFRSTALLSLFGWPLLGFGLAGGLWWSRR